MNKQSRKWLLTLNDPEEKGYSREKIKSILAGLKSVIYWCLANEIGLEQHTAHIHLFIICKNGMRFSTLKKCFPEAHMDMAHGSCEEVRAYVQKSGKWADDPKADTRIPDSFEEWGELPMEHQGQRTEWDKAYQMLEDGNSTIAIIRDNTAMMRYRTSLEQTRQEILAEQFRKTFRLLDVTYIFGTTGLGKTRYVMDKFGYENVCQITNYQRGIFDKYRGEDVLILDEFNSGFAIQDMNIYLDGYPLQLPCRYADRVACFQKVFIISNIRLEHQYPTAQVEHTAVWDAFIRRINNVMVFYGLGEYDTFTTEAYFRSLPPYAPKGGIG